MKYSLKPYDQWPTDEHERWIEIGNTFGTHLMQAARDEAFAKIPENATKEERARSEKIVFDALYGVTQLLDGVFFPEIDPSHKVEYTLHARVCDHKGDCVETFELAPEGDGLCQGIHGWWENDFGQKED